MSETDILSENSVPTLTLDALSAFLAEFVRKFIAADGETVRVGRSAQRIGLAFGMSVECCCSPVIQR